MARVLTNEELRMIEEELWEKDVPRAEIAHHLKDMRKFEPGKKVGFKGMNPEELSSIRSQREKTGETISFK